MKILLFLTLIMVSCQKETNICAYCEILGHPELSQDPQCGDEAAVNEMIEARKKVYHGFEYRCKIVKN